MNTATANEHREPSRRVQGPLDRRAQGAAGARKGTDAPARPDRPRAPRAAVGAHREELRLRGARGPAHARRSVRRPPPTAGAALHVRSGLGARLPELLVHGRPQRRHDRAPGASRHHVRGDLARAAGRDRALSPAHGLAVQVGVLVRQRLQPRLRRELHARGAGQGRGLLQLRHAGISRPRNCPASACSTRTTRATSSTPTRPTGAAWR